MNEAFAWIEAIDSLPWQIRVVAGFVWGAAMGSYLTVVTWRLPRRLDVIRGRSICPHCKRELAAWENIPVVAWLALRGRCRICKSSIPARYVLLEILSGVIGASLAMVSLVMVMALSVAIMIGTAVASEVRRKGVQ